MTENPEIPEENTEPTEETPPVETKTALESFRAAIEAGLSDISAYSLNIAGQMRPAEYSVAVKEGLLTAQNIIFDKMRQWDEYEL